MEKMLPFGLIFVCFFVCLFQGLNGYPGLPRFPLGLTDMFVFTEIPKVVNSLCTIMVFRNLDNGLVFISKYRS